MKRQASNRLRCIVFLAKGCHLDLNAVNPVDRVDEENSDENKRYLQTVSNVFREVSMLCPPLAHIVVWPQADSQR